MSDPLREARGDALSGAARAAAVLGHIRAVVLMGGSVRSKGFAQAIGRSLLDLPIEAGGKTLMMLWQDQAAGLARECGVRQLPLRVMLDRDAVDPAAAVSHEYVIVSVERDPNEYRGTGGVLRDLAVGYADDDYLVVANAGQLLAEPLSGLVREMAGRGADVVVVGHEDGTPSGMMLVRCGAAKALPAAGFLDMKEQALPALAKGHRVEVVERAVPCGLPIRHLLEYVGAVRRHHMDLAGAAEDPDPFREDWDAAFGIVEVGAAAEGARVHDSVVLRGARVESGAVLVRSVVCAGAVVRKGTMAVEEVIAKGLSGERSGGRRAGT